MESSMRPAVSMFSEYFRIPSSVHSRSIISFMPNTVLMGVRISWDMEARKRLFESERARASFFSCFAFSASRTALRTATIARARRPMRTRFLFMFPAPCM